MRLISSLSLGDWWIIILHGLSSPALAQCLLVSLVSKFARENYFTRLLLLSHSSCQWCEKNSLTFQALFFCSTAKSSKWKHHLLYPCKSQSNVFLIGYVISDLEVTRFDCSIHKMLYKLIHKEIIYVNIINMYKYTVTLRIFGHLNHT